MDGATGPKALHIGGHRAPTSNRVPWSGSNDFSPRYSACRFKFAVTRDHAKVVGATSNKNFPFFWPKISIKKPDTLRLKGRGGILLIWRGPIIRRKMLRDKSLFWAHRTAIGNKYGQRRQRRRLQSAHTGVVGYYLPRSTGRSVCRESSTTWLRSRSSSNKSLTCRCRQ